MENKYFLITWSESDEIHFILMDMKHYDYVVTIYNEFCNGTFGRIDELLEFCYKNNEKDEFIQTYCDDAWYFDNYTISRIISIPEFGN